jgi:dTDP-4-dehydrorhamnose 3,5-epimerase
MDTMSAVIPKVAGGAELVAKQSAVDEDGRLRGTPIAGVQFRPTRPVPHEDRHVTEVARASWEILCKPLVQVHLTTTLPGRIRAWGLHRTGTDRLFVASGLIKIVVFDGRASSPTFGGLNEFLVSEKSPGLLIIPPELYHGWKNIGPAEALIINMPDPMYNYAAPDALARRVPAFGDWLASSSAACVPETTSCPRRVWRTWPIGDSRGVERRFATTELRRLEGAERFYLTDIEPGFEWHLDETDDRFGPFRWSGPSVRSAVDLPVFFDADLLIRIHVVHATELSAVEQLKLCVNSRLLECRSEKTASGTVVVRALARVDPDYVARMAANQRSRAREGAALDPRDRARFYPQQTEEERVEHALDADDHQRHPQ